MLHNNWQQHATDLLTSALGSTTNVAINDIIQSLDINNRTLGQTEYLELVMHLSHMLRCSSRAGKSGYSLQKKSRTSVRLF